MSLWLKSTIKEIIVYRSLSQNIFSNLALEDWILHNIDHKDRRILLLWRNEPCVVIGRYQNPWMETDISKLEATKTVLARRKSGGGTVYHDLGNLNCTLFTHKSDYNRLRNLQLVCDAINEIWKVGLYVGERNDILYQRKKVSGSAARIGKDHTYHHFTLLLDVNERNLHSLLKQHEAMTFLSSTATTSVPSPVVNLKSFSDMTYSSVCNAIASRFYGEHKVNEKYHQIVDIDPLHEVMFPGISDIRTELENFEWIWNKTPKFTVQIEQVKFEVANGMITNVTPNVNNAVAQGTLFKNFLEKKFKF